MNDDGMLEVRTHSEPFEGQRVHLYLNGKYVGTERVAEDGCVHLDSPLKCDAGDTLRVCVERRSSGAPKA